MTSETLAPQAAALPINAGALAGIRIADVTQFESGTSCTEMLAWLGAEVIKVEEPTLGDRGRRAKPGEPDSYYFQVLNANKQSVTADLKHEKGKAILRELIEKSDVFIENFAPGAIERLGFGWDEVHKINPRIIMAQIKGFAPEGPYGKYLSFDTVAQCSGGSAAVTGEAGGRPMRAGVTIGDTGTGVHCALGIVSALFQRNTTGRGQRVEIAMQETVINLARISHAATLQNGGKVQPRGGNGGMFSKAAPSDLFPCKGGGQNDYCYIHAKYDGHWQRLAKLIGREDLLTNPDFADGKKRWERHEEVDGIVTSWTMQNDKRTVMKLLGDAGIPAGAVYDPKEISEDETLRKRGTMVTVEHPVLGTFTMPGLPIKLSDSKVPVAHAPLLGADSDKVYGELLGYGKEKIAELRTENVI